jgi:hypothetical protein
LILDLVWALTRIQRRGGNPADVRELFGIKGASLDPLFESSLASDFRTYFFDRDQDARDISGLDPNSEDAAEAGWGRLTGTSERIGAVVARVTARHAGANP